MAIRTVTPEGPFSSGFLHRWSSGSAVGSREVFGVQVSGFRFQVSGFRVQGSGFRVQGSGFRRGIAPGASRGVLSRRVMSRKYVFGDISGRRTTRGASRSDGAIVLSRGTFVAKTRCWRHNALFIELRRAGQLDRVGAIGLKLAGIVVRFCRVTHGTGSRR
jgi:hypothetical protein